MLSLFFSKKNSHSLYKILKGLWLNFVQLNKYLVFFLISTQYAEYKYILNDMVCIEIEHSTQLYIKNINLINLH